MNKRWVLTTVAAGVSLAFALGGWLLTSMLIERQHMALMNTVHSIRVSEPSAPDQSAESPAPGQTPGPVPVTLSVKEIADIVTVWQSGGTPHYHDPMEGQLTMEGAINAAKGGLSYFCDSGALPKQILADDFTETSAFLYMIEDSSSAIVASTPACSFWSVSLSNQDVLVKLTLNAQTGRIWMADIYSSSPAAAFDDVKVLDVLDAFETYLGLSGGGSLRSDTDSASKIYENQLAIAAYKKRGDSDRYAYLNILLMTVDN